VLNVENIRGKIFRGMAIFTQEPSPFCNPPALGGREFTLFLSEILRFASAILFYKINGIWMKIKGGRLFIMFLHAA
jgi:hypothetical protein